MERIETIDQYNKLTGQQTLHPLVSVTDLSRMSRIGESRVSYGFYTILLRKVGCGSFRYGLRCSDFQSGTLVCTVPRRMIDLRDAGETFLPGVTGLLFHPDLLRSTSLGCYMDRYTFFSYRENEALHVSEQEKRMVTDHLHHIEAELWHAIDRHSKKLIVTSIELLLDYVKRFYERQFITREHLNRDILSRFEKYVYEYYDTSQPLKIGFPPASYYAEKLNLSDHYFSDMLEVETGKTVLEYNQLKLIDVAKERIRNTWLPIDDIAAGLGFKQPRDFIRLFKNCVGCTPGQYRLKQ